MPSTQDFRTNVPAVGDLIDGRYLLKRILGEGAEGTVFEAAHTHSGQRVALKILRLSPSLALAEKQLVRFHREANVLGVLRHPNIVSLLDASVAPNPFLVLELLEGRTLDSLIIARERLMAVESVNVVLQAAEALAFAHGCGVVHRDVKPKNIIVALDKIVGERIKVVDFGTSKQSMPERNVTAVGELVGTPAYMAPEQLMGEQDIDGRADVYALAVVLFECLSGRVLHEGNYAQILRAVFSETPNIRSALSGVSPALVCVIERATSRDRKHRPASIAQLALELRRACPQATGKTRLLERRDAARRHFDRAPFSGPALVLATVGAIDARVQDISEGGILVLAPTACNVDEIVTIRLTLPIEGVVATCHARVRWIRGRIMGMEFINAAPEMCATIARYVALMAHEGPAATLPSTPIAIALAS